ncbi:pitrilysin family protein [Mesorhizobium sp. STM 4661]|uniref:M16 family metallopeptidase n=1 Tax=Mesorhizobium sp. STM 4661 TaxID=1297570 RepID=UPI0002C01306|nr:pitrilysin family protein [Mesorhizobium sp. STM 4661]CCV16036.1 putative Peptidase M16 domain protein [Mesorhizobium sp. STM 4661]
MGVRAGVEGDWLRSAALAWGLIMVRVLLALTVMLAVWSGALAAEPARSEPIATYALDNGLQVVLVPDHRAPKVVMNLRYRVGSMNEPAGRSGFAHLFEHLMFSGTPAWPNVFGAHAALGNKINAWTTEDGTVYYVDGLSSSLPMILSLEADRMANLGRSVTQAKLDLQRSVVKNEMRQNVLDKAGASGWEAFWSGLFPKPHPYSRMVIGSVADLDAATLDDVRGFFNTYYLPNNAVLVLVGDLEVVETRALIADTFGRVLRGADVARPAIPEPGQARLRLALEDRVPSPIVVIGFSGPVARSPDNGALSITAELLGNGDYGFLRNRLVLDKGVATYANANWTGGLLGGRFTFEAGAAQGVAPETLEAEMKAAFADFLKTPFDPADLERARNRILLGARLGTEALKDRAGAVSYNADILGDAQSALQDDPRVKNASAADVEATIKRLLKLEDASVLVLKPGPRGGYPDALIGSSGTPQPFTAPERVAIDIPKHPAGKEPSAALPAMETATLTNGIRLVHYTMPEAPMVYVAASAEGGWNSVPQGKEGLLELAASMATRGAGERGSADFAKATNDIGASIGYQADYLTTAMTLGVPAEKLDQGVALLADAVLKPRFDQPDWAILTAQTSDWLAGREADLPGVAGRAAKAALIPQAPGKAGIDWSAKALASITLDEAKAAFKAVFTPKAVTFYSVGPVSAQTVAASLEKAFGAWAGDAVGLAVEPSPPALFTGGQKVLLVPEPGASQSALFVARPAPGTDESERAEATAVANLLGDDFSSRLNSVIREEKGYSYGVSSYLLSPMKTGSGLVVAATVERDNTGPAISEILKGFAGLKTLPVAQEEVDLTVIVYRRSLAGSAETSAGLFGTLVGAVGTGSTLEDQQSRMTARTALTLEAVRKQALSLSSLDPSLIVVAGDPDVVMPQLAAIGLKQVEIVRRETVKPAGEQTAMRALDLLGGKQQAPLTASPWRVGDGGTTRAVHSCEDGKDCGARIHAE